MPNTNAADWQDDLETYGDAFANVIIYDEDQVTHLTDFTLQPADLRVVFAALRDAAQRECGHNDQGLNDDRLVACYECGYVFPPAPETAEQIAERVLDNHRIRPDWRRTGEQIIPLLAEAVRIARGEE